MAFSDNLQFLRTRQGQTQEQLAERLEVSRQSVSKWEGGQSYPEMDTILRICDLYHVDLDTLLRGSVEDSLVEDTAQYDRFMNRFSKRMAFAIGGIIADVALLSALHGYDPGDSFAALSIGLFMLILAVCVVVIVASSLQSDNFRKVHPVLADFYPEEQKQAFRQKFVWFIAGGVGAILFDVALLLVLSPAGEPYESYGMSIFLFIVAGAVTAFVYAGIQEDKYKIWKYNRDNNPTPEVKKRKAAINTICAALMTATTAIYVGAGLAQNLWKTTWWIFAVSGILCAVVHIILDPYKDED